ncbi:beta-ketoacyl reductase, partial [Streptomyces sp. MH13]|uniref:acyl carrier protein n=2 Tax=unclassified Streptomyces TaxID=2593676 RepID=UPI003CF1A151
FSSLAGLLGGPGQGNYAAGNVFADTVVQWRRQAGLPGVSLAWGSWTPDVGLTGTLSDNDLQRLTSSGMLPLSVEQGLELFDQALLADQAVVGLTRLRRQGERSPLMPSLGTRGVARRIAGNDRRDPGGFAQRWVTIPADERHGFLLDLIRGHVAAVLGHASTYKIENGRAFRELGFDSLTAVELRNRLATVTGVSLPATLVFDYPTPDRVATYLREQIAGEEPSAAEPVLTYLNNLKRTFPSVVSDAADRDRIAERLREILDMCGEPEETDLADLESASDDDLFALVDKGID